MPKKSKKATTAKSSKPMVFLAYQGPDGLLYKAPTHGRFSYPDRLSKVSPLVVSSTSEAVIDKVVGRNARSKKIREALSTLAKKGLLVVIPGECTVIGKRVKDLDEAKARLQKMEEAILRFFLAADSEASKYNMYRQREANKREGDALKEKTYGVLYSLWARQLTEFSRVMEAI